jgi:hypothetical protein
MVIKCTLPFPLKVILPYLQKMSELPPLPGYITQRGPFINNDGRDKNRVVIAYDFDESRLAEAWEIVLNHLNVFRDIPGFTFFAHRSDGLAKEIDWQSIGLKNRRLVSITEKDDVIGR